MLSRIFDAIVASFETCILLINNKIHRREICKSHIYNELLKKYTKNASILSGWFSIFAPKSRKSAKFTRREGPERAKNGQKRVSGRCPKEGKCIFILLIYSEIAKKCKKNKKKFARVLFGIQKKLFLHSQTTTTWGERKRGVVNRGMFIERMKECSKYSRRGIWDSQAMKSGQTT